MHMHVQLHAFVFTHGVQKKEQVSSVIFSYSFQVGSVLKTRDCVFSARLEASKPWSPYYWGYKHTRTAQLGHTWLCSKFPQHQANQSYSPAPWEMLSWTIQAKENSAKGRVIQKTIYHAHKTHDWCYIKKVSFQASLTTWADQTETTTDSASLPCWLSCLQAFWCLKVQELDPDPATPPYYHSGNLTIFLAPIDATMQWWLHY